MVKRERRTIEGLLTAVCVAACGHPQPVRSPEPWARWSFPHAARPDLHGLHRLQDGYADACGLRDGALVCWRRRIDLTYTLHNVRPLTAFTVVEGRGCVVDVDHEVSCWSEDLAYGSLGSYPERVEGFGGRRTPVQLARSSTHVCAVLDNGRVACAGDSGCAESERRERRGAAIVPSLRRVVQVATGLHFSCSRHTDGDVRCWGDLWSPGPAGPQRLCTSPARAQPILSGITKLSVHGDVICTLDGAGVVRCWGDVSARRTFSPCRLRLPGPARDVEVTSDVWITLVDGRIFRSSPGWFCDESWELEEVR